MIIDIKVHHCPKQELFVMAETTPTSCERK